MASPGLVPESAYDHAEIIRRGGENGFDEDFMLVKCLHCGELYLYDAEIDTVFTDPENLSLEIARLAGPEAKEHPSRTTAGLG